MPMEQLVQSFPTLSDAPGADAWSPEAFLEWLTGPAPGSGARHAGRFILEVASRRYGTDWAQLARAEGITGFEHVVVPFSLFDAMGLWDRAHVAALAAWMGVPGVVRPSLLDEPRKRGAAGELDEEVVTVKNAEGQMTGPKWLVEAWRLETQQQAERSSRWPKDRTLAMSVLARSFLSLAGAPGLEPWNVDTFLPWLCSPERHPSALHAGRFLLGVWNPGADWQELAAELGLSQCASARPFNLLEAVETWDAEHLAAAVAWMDAPFWP
jgi:hypothetical protein